MILDSEARVSTLQQCEWEFVRKVETWRPMKIAIISRSDESAGGASRAAHLLAVCLRQQGCLVDEWIVFLKDRYNRNCNMVFPGYVGMFLPYLSYIGSRILGLHDLFGFDVFKLPQIIKKHDYDLIHFHDVVTAISPITMSYISKSNPTVLTLHDCASFTGGCIYPGVCDKYKNICGKCQQLRSWPICSAGFDLTGSIQYLKRRIHKQKSIKVIAPSEWMRQMAIGSGVFAERPALIPYGIDVDTFRPIDKSTIRGILGLPVDKPIAVFAATHVDDPRKGFEFALEAARRMNAVKDLVLLAIGHPPRTSAKLEVSGLDCRFIGFVRDTRLLMQFFAAADVFLFPTLYDNAPLVVLENMAVGTPIIAFKTGGIPEMVIHGRTGYLVDQGDTAGLVKGLEEALYRGKGLEWGGAARRRAVESYSLEQHTRAHMEFYDLLIHRNAPRNT
jgi:glycosyltransferase involved in cell wall biosynthesis